MTRRAFTLLEVLIALSLMAVLSLGLGAFVRDVRVQQRSMQRLATQVEGSSVLLELLERSAAACIADAGVAGAGVSGTPSSLRIHSRAVVLQTAGRWSDLTALDFRFLKAQHAVTLERTAPGYADSAAAGPVASQLEHVRFRYHDGSDWHPTFDSLARGRLPVAIEVAIWYADARATPAPPIATEPEDSSESDDSLPKRAPDRLRIISVHDSRTDEVTP